MKIDTSKTGEYVDALLRPDSRVRRFTAYVDYDGSVEEIDVDAVGEHHAHEIALAAIARDYEPGGRIVGVEERFGWYL